MLNPHCLLCLVCLCLCIWIFVGIWIADTMGFQKMYGLRGPLGLTAVLQLINELRKNWRGWTDGAGREGTGIKGSIRGPCRSKKALKGGLDKQLYVSKKFIRKHWQFPIPTLLPILKKRPRKLFPTNAVRAICCFSGIIRTYISVNLRWPLMFFSSTTSCASEYLSEKVVMQHQPPPLWARWPKTLLSEVSN